MSNIRVITSFAVIIASCYASVISTSDARLPMSLSTVISDLEAEGCNEISTCCLITSRSVTRNRQAKLLDALLGSDREDITMKAAGTASGLVLAQPDASEVALTACACDGKIVYYADTTDLLRGEGLFDALAPAMEKLLGAERQGQPKLIVIVDDTDDGSLVKNRLEQAAERVVKTLISDRTVSSLQDVFSQVVYVSLDEAANNMVTAETAMSPPDAMSKIAELATLESTIPSSFGDTSFDSVNLAAARTLGPTARVILNKAISQVDRACQDDEGNAKFVPSFGELCDAAVHAATQSLTTEAADSPSLLHSKVGKQLTSNLETDLLAELGDYFDTQLDFLQLLCFDEFKRAVSKLLVSHNLAKDMDNVVNEFVSRFSKSSSKLLAKGSHWSIQPAKQILHLKLKDFCTHRLVVARAAGQYKPLPRKGVTFGMHWLLPKPFGNDFRQEPWMVHATDGMIFIPKDKITDVSLEEAGTGSWLNKVVPAPAGNELLYMQ
jgi:hypothetical protein